MKIKSSPSSTRVPPENSLKMTDLFFDFTEETRAWRNGHVLAQAYAARRGKKQM